MSNSPLVSYTQLSPNHSGKRYKPISRISPHCVVGQLTAEGIGKCFAKATRLASCNYGIGYDGRVALVVEEGNRSWCTSDRDNDQRAVTIECASDRKKPYAMTDAVYKSLINLCVDICKRNGKKKLLWFGDKAKTLAYEPADDEMVITVHRWFKNKACPGDWLYSRLGDLAAKVTAKLASGETPTAPMAPAAPERTKVSYLVRVTADALNIRKGPGTKYEITGKITNKGAYTIVEESAGWGRLKSGAGWISLAYTKKI